MDIAIVVVRAHHWLWVRFFNLLFSMSLIRRLESIADCALNYLGYRERQFIRAQVLEDYVANIRSIYEQEAALMTRSDELILTIFDPFQLSVQSIADSSIAKALEYAGDE